MRIYVSSTSEDLREFRAAVVEQLIRLKHQVVSMEGYTADARGPVEKCLADVASAEAYVGLFAFHYGSIPAGGDRSITEMEFRKATECGLPRLIFLVSDDVTNWPAKFFDRGKTSLLMDAFRTELLEQKGFTAALFKDLPQLLKLLPQAIESIAGRPEPVVNAHSGARASFHDWIKPLNYDVERNRHLAHFTGREWVDARLDDWIVKNSDSKVFCLIGGPGIGKSAIACHWCHARKDVVAFHHCVHDDEVKTDPKSIVVSLIAQFAARSSEFAARLAALDVNEIKKIVNGEPGKAADAGNIFQNLFARFLNADFPAPERTQLAVIDGLDEAGRTQDNKLVNFLGRVWMGVPKWLRLVVTSRPELNVRAYLASLHPFILDAGRPENLEDIRCFLRARLSTVNVDDKAINQIVKKSEGMFLYATLVSAEILAGELSLEKIADFPEGLTGYYEDWFRRKFPDAEEYLRDFHQLVSVIIAQKAPLPVNAVSSALGFSTYVLDQRFNRLGVLFPLREEGPGKTALWFVTLMHKSLHDWLTERNPTARAGVFAADLEKGNGLLAEVGWKTYAAGQLTQDSYFRQTILSHLADAKQVDRLASILFDPVLLDEIWFGDARYDWQRHISHLRHTVSLAKLVKDWIAARCAPENRTANCAAIAGKLGRLFQEMGAFDEALLLVDAALRMWEAEAVVDSPDMVACLLAEGTIQSARDELDRAAASYEKALAIAQRAYAPDSSQMADVLYQLCVFYTKGKRDYKKAWDHLEKALAIYSATSPPNSAGMANCINDKAVILEAEGKAGDYLGFYQQALDLFQQAHPNGHPEMVACLSNIGYELRKRSKHGEALEVLRRAVAMAEKILLPQHEYSSSARSGMANALLASGKYHEALEIVRAHLTELERFPGPSHVDTAVARLWLCELLYHVVLLSEAKRESYREEFRRQCQKISAAKPETILGLVGLAEVAGRAAEPALRDDLMETARRSCRRYSTQPRSEPADTTAAKCFADIFETILSDQKLCYSSTRVVAIWEAAEPQMKHQSDCVSKTRKLILSLISWAGRTRLERDNDIAAVQQSFDLISQLGANIPETFDYLATLTVSLHGRRHEEISWTLCQRLFEKCEGTLGREHIQTMTYLENLAALTMHRGKHAEAEQMYREALKRRLAAHGVEQNNSLSDVSNVAECLLLQSDNAAAQKLIREFAVQLPPADTYTCARKMLADCLRGSGMQLKNEFAVFVGARVCDELAMEIDPDNATGHNNLALLLWTNLNDPDSAAVHWEKSLALNPTDGTAQSNYAHFLAQERKDFARSRALFEKAATDDPNNHGPPANHAALLILQDDLAGAWKMAGRTMRLSLPSPDRIMARPLFCAAAILLLRNEDAATPLGQMKTLFDRGIDHATWMLTALLEKLDRQLPREPARLMRAISEAINEKPKLDVLKADPAWQAIKPVPFDAPWPKPAGVWDSTTQFYRQKPEP